jgi:hypothetical protein
MICHNEFDYSALQGFEKLNEEQKRIVQAEYERGYMSARHLGIKLATGRGYETAKLALEQQFRPKTLKEQPVPPSIFEGLDNC